LIQFFRSYDEKELPQLLKTKFKAALDLYEDMLKPLPRKRPNCEQILEKKDLWTLNEKELEINDELRKEINSKLNNQNKFVFDILASTLNCLNVLLPYDGARAYGFSGDLIWTN
jgi:hypothetical protein